MIPVGARPYAARTYPKGKSGQFSSNIDDKIMNDVTVLSKLPAIALILR